MTVQLKFARSTKENLLFLVFLSAFLFISGAFVPENQPFAGIFLAETCAQDTEEDDFSDEEEDFFDDEEADDFDDEEADDLGDEEADDLGDEEVDEEDGEDAEDPDSGEAGSDETDENPDIKDSLLEEYQNDTLYSIKDWKYGDASIREILASDPQTVPELVAAARDFAALQRFDLANLFYQKAMDASPTEDDVTRLVTTYGRAYFVTLSENEKIAPAGIAFGKFILRSLENRFHSDPEFIQEMIDQLFSESEEERKVAETELMAYRSRSIPALIENYADREEESERKVLEKMLLMFGEGLTSAAAACLESNSEALQLAAVDLLYAQASRNNPEALMHLFYATAVEADGTENTKNEDGAKALHEKAKKAIQKLFSLRTLTSVTQRKFLEKQLARLQYEKKLIENSGNVDTIEVIWRWVPEEETLQPMTANRLMKYRLNSYRLAKALWNIFPEDPLARRMLFMTTSEYVTTFHTFTETKLKSDQIIQTAEFQRVKEEFSLSEIESYLLECLDAKFYDAAIMAVLALGEKGDETLLQAIPARKGHTVTDPSLCVAHEKSYSPLVMALHTPNRLLRFAAVQAIMKLDPQKPFTGSSRLTDTLAWFLQTNGRSKVLIGEMTTAEAMSLGGQLRQFELGYEIATSPREILEKGLQFCDYTMILMNVRLLETNSDLLIQQIGLDPRTADVPIVLLAWPDDFKLAQQLAERIPKCIWYPYPSRNEDLALLLSLAGRIKTSVNLQDKQRIAETRAVLLWTRDIIRSHQSGWVQKRRFNASPAVKTDAMDPSILENAGSVNAGSEEDAPDAENADAGSEDENADTEADEELDSLLAAGESLPDAQTPDSSKETEPDPTAQWDREPLRIYDITKLIPPVMKIYFYPEFLKEALEVLRWTGTPQAQQTLAFIGTSGTFSYSASKRAARLLRESTLRFGVLMTADQIGEFYDLYNETPVKKAKLLEVRGLVLDALEAPLDPNAVPDLSLDVEVPPVEDPEEDSDAEESDDEEDLDEEDLDEEDLDEEDLDEEELDEEELDEEELDEEELDEEELDEEELDEDEEFMDENEKALEEGPLDEEDGSSDEELPEDELDADEDADANDEPAADEDANADDEPEDADLNEEELEDLEDALDMEIEPI